MIKKIKEKICEFFCKMLDITPCVCKHNCECKEKAEKKNAPE
jgi:hypothetical protein